MKFQIWTDETVKDFEQRHREYAEDLATLQKLRQECSDINETPEDQANQVYHLLVLAKFPGKQEGLLIDTSARGNLPGDKWFERFSRNRKVQPHESKLEKPEVCQGIGTGMQMCTMQKTIDTAIKDVQGEIGVYVHLTSTSQFRSSCHPRFGFPGATGGVIDLRTRRFYLSDVDDSHAEKIIANADAVVVLMERAMSGHLLGPCAEFLSEGPRPDAEQ